MTVSKGSWNICDCKVPSSNRGNPNKCNTCGKAVYNLPIPVIHDLYENHPITSKRIDDIVKQMTKDELLYGQSGYYMDKEVIRLLTQEEIYDSRTKTMGETTTDRKPSTPRFK